MKNPEKYNNDYTQAYINFPITLLIGARENIIHTCENILNYACYEFANRPENVSLSPHDRIKAAMKYYGTSYTQDDYKRGENLDRTYNTPKSYKLTKPPKCGISVTMLYDFLKNYKRPFEIESLLGYCAIRSILQKQRYLLVTKSYIVARMAGFATSAESSKAPPKIAKYLKRYHFDKLINELTEHWYLEVYAQHTNGLYVSFALTYEELGVDAEMNKKKNKAALRKSNKKDENERITKIVNYKLKKGESTTP